MDSPAPCGSCYQRNTLKVKYCLLSNPAFVVTFSGDFIKVQTNTESDLDQKDGTRKTDCFCPTSSRNTAGLNSIGKFSRLSIFSEPKQKCIEIQNIINIAFYVLSLKFKKTFRPLKQYGTLTGVKCIIQYLNVVMMYENACTDCLISSR